jgi:hypothetical protein
MNQIAKRLRRTVILGLTSLAFLIAVGTVLTLITAHAYAGTCSQLGGFAGTCKNTAAANQAPVCTCVPNTISK